METLLRLNTITLLSYRAGFISILAICWLLFSFAARGITVLNFEMPPSPSDDFLEAAFRFTNPNPKEIPQRILVYVPGTDGDARNTVNDLAFLEACHKCRAALVGCYFRGEGLPYDNPSKGSGRALDEALEYFGLQTHQSQLAKLPLLLMGFSEGAQFTFNYVCWHPDRIEAFAAIKAGSFALDPKEESFRVPGLMVAGQYDEPRRIRATAQAFVTSAGKNSRWAFLFEKGAGHDMTRIGPFALQFLDAACENKKNNVYRDPDTGSDSASGASVANLCWFPDEAIADSWTSLRHPIPLAHLIHMPDQVSLESVISIMLNLPSFHCKNGQTQEGAICLSSAQKDATIEHISIAGTGFALDGGDKGNLPSQTTVSFSPVGLDWGPVSANVTIFAQQGGHELAPDTITLHGEVGGAASAVPRVLYMGVAQPHEIVRKTVHIDLSEPNAHVTQIASPSSLTAKLETIQNSRELILQATWSPSDRLGSMTGEIRIGFDLPQKGTLRIPVVGLVERQAQ